MRHAHAGGTERHLNQVAAHLAELGHEVTILCRSHEQAPHPRVRFELLRPFAIGATWRVASFAYAVERHLQRHSYDVVYGLGRTWTQDALRLGGGSHATYLETAHASTRVGLKRLTTLWEPKHAFQLRAERRALLSPDLRRVVVNARMVQEDIMRRYGLPATRFELIYNGVDLERFHPAAHSAAGANLRRELGIDPTTPVLLFLGSGYARKGLDLVLRTFARLRTRRAQLIVVGYDSAQSLYEAQARALGVRDRAHFLGGRRDTQVCYAAADLYLLPTLYDPFANTTLEALAAGLPALTTRTNGAHELISDGVDGSILPSGSEGPDAEQAWAEAIERWLEPVTLCGGRAAARALAEQHSVESKMRATAKMLEELTRGSPSTTVEADMGS
jgi:UDP-glucose:(heptosyl)LPS alpha-1,3-glucosyltransferase